MAWSPFSWMRALPLVQVVLRPFCPRRRQGMRASALPQMGLPCQVLVWDRLRLTGSGLRLRLVQAFLSPLSLPAAGRIGSCSRPATPSCSPCPRTVSGCSFVCLLFAFCLWRMATRCSCPQRILWLLHLLYGLATAHHLAQTPSVPPPAAATLRDLLSYTDDEIVMALRGWTTSSEMARLHDIIGTRVFDLLVNIPPDRAVAAFVASSVADGSNNPSRRPLDPSDGAQTHGTGTQFLGDGDGDGNPPAPSDGTSVQRWTRPSDAQPDAIADGSTDGANLSTVALHLRLTQFGTSHAWRSDRPRSPQVLCVPESRCILTHPTVRGF